MENPGKIGIWAEKKHCEKNKCEQRHSELSWVECLKEVFKPSMTRILGSFYYEWGVVETIVIDFEIILAKIMKTLVGCDSQESKRMHAAWQKILFSKQTWTV